MIFAFKCGCSLSGKHLWIHQDSPIPRPTKHGKFQEPLATSPWGRSWNGASPGVQQPGGPGEVVPKRFCVKAWCLELIKVYKSGKFLMIFYDILSYTVYIYIYIHTIYTYIFLWMLNRWSLRHPLFLFGGRFLCLDEALTEAIYSFGGNVGEVEIQRTRWRVYTWENNYGKWLM